MKRLFKKKSKPYYLRSQKHLYQYSNTSTPKSKADACVSCDLPFDESEIAPELRRENTSVVTPDSPRGKEKESPPLNCTNLETVDISVDEGVSGIPSTPPQKSEEEIIETTVEENRKQESIYNKTTEKGREKEQSKTDLEETVFATGGLREPEINSPADIYKHFPRRVAFEDERSETDGSSSEEIGSRENVSDSDDQFSDDNAVRSPSNTQKAGTSVRGKTVKQMFNQETPEDVAAELLHSYQQTLNNLAQKLLIKDVRIDNFHGRDNEDISRWFEKLELLLTTKGIDKTGPLAIAQIINNLSGPAETFLFELPPEERESFEKLKCALMKRYATKDRTWVKRQRLITRHQGPNELLSDYINDMHELFSGLHVAEVDKVTYFIEGLLPSMKIEVLKKMPETLQEAEECARTLDSINKRVSQHSENGQMERLINALMINGQVPAGATGTSSQPVNQQIQSINTKLDVLANKLESVAPKEVNSEKLAAYVEPERESQPGVTRLIRELTDDLRQEIQQQVQHLDARINGLARRGVPNRYESQQPRQRTRDGRPICFDCGSIGHIQQSCPYRRARPIPNALPAPGTQRRMEQRNSSYNPVNAPPASGPQRRMEQWSNSYNPGYQSAQRALPSRRQERLAAFGGVAYEEENYGHYLEDYDVGELCYYNMNPRLLEEVGNVGGQFIDFPVQKEPDFPGATQTTDHQDVWSLTCDDYLGREEEDNPPSDLNFELFGRSPASQFRDEETEDEFEWPTPPPPITDIALTEDEFEWPTPPPPITDIALTEVELNLVSPPIPSDDIAVIESDLDIVPSPPSTADMAVIHSELGSVPPPPPMDDCAATTSSLELIKLPPPKDDEPQLASRVVAAGTGDGLPQATADCQVHLNVVEAPLVPDVVDALEDEVKEAEVQQLPQVMPNRADNVHTTDQTEETLPTSSSARRAISPSGNEPNIASTTGGPDKPHELTVPVQLNGKPTRFLVDTGASMSVIDYKHLLELYDDIPPMKQTSSSRAIQTVSGEQLPIVGTITVTLSIAGGAYPWELKVIKGLTYRAVLGRDFLRAHGAVINLQTGMLELEDHPPSSSMEELRSIHAFSTYVIPPRSEAVIPARVHGALPPGTIGLVESAPRLAERYHLQGATTLVTVSEADTIPFRLINPTTKPVTLYKGATLGTFAETGEDLNVHPIGEEIESKTSASRQQASIPVDLSDSNLTLDQQTQLRALLDEYRDIFALSPNELGRTNLVQHSIDTEGHAPIRLRPYRAPQVQKETIEKHIADMLERNVIQPSVSPWASPVVLVSKPDGSTRFCCDFRKLNQVTKKDSYPLPLISESLEALSGTQYFSTMDLMSGYWQVELDPQAREKTAFTTHAGLYEFITMPFGLCNAPSTFQRLMECVLRGLTWQIALIYLDDVLVYSCTFEEHLKHLRLVFDRFRGAGLKLKPNKCHFGQSRVNYLGHVITPEGLQPDPEKIKVVQEYPVPRTVRDIRAFMGLANYYRKFVKNFAKMASPLHDLTKKGTKFVWTSTCQVAFDALKKALTEAPILSYPDFTQPFLLSTDASDDALGMVLGQKQNGREVVIAYGGRKLNPAERNYSVTEREALAVVAGIKHFQHYLYGRKFTVFTDHNAVRWLMNIREPTGRLARWALVLQQYDFEIVHRAGKNNGNADALSRRQYQPTLATLDCPGVQTDKIRELQRRDPPLADIINYLETERLPKEGNAAKALLHTIEDYFLDPDGVLCHIYIPRNRRMATPRTQLVVPTPLRHEILIGGHDHPTAGHLGVNKTYDKLRDRYFWPKMFADVQHWVLSCSHCQMKKSPKQRRTAPVLPIAVEGPFHRVAVDCLGPFPVTNSGNRYIVVFSDYLTRFPEAFAVPSIDAATIADLLVNEIMARHGAPRTLLSDRGSNFLSSLLKEVCYLMDTKKVFTTSYHPQCDGLVERFNGTLAQSLSMYVSSDQKDWDKYLNPVLFAYRVSPSDVTGESPFYMLYGREPRLPMDVSLLPPREMSPSIAEHRARVVEHIEIAHRIARENIQRAQQRMKDYHDRTAVPLKYTLGDRVWVYTPKNRKGLSKKLAHNYHGPYRIVKFLSPVHCILRATDNRRVSTTVHISRLKPYVDPADRPIRQPPNDVEEPFLAEDDFPDDSFLPEQPAAITLPQAMDQGNNPDHASPNQASTISPPQSVDSARLRRSTRTPLQAPNEVQTTDDSSTKELQGTGSPDTEQSAEDVYQVEKILKQRRLNGEHQFLIKWLGFPHSQNTWEPVSNIIDKRSIAQFYKQHPRAKRFDEDPDYQPRMAAFVTAEFPNNHAIAAFSHEIICPSVDGDSRASRQGITTLRQPPSLRVSTNELNRECSLPLPRNTEDAIALKPLTSKRLHHASTLERSTSSNPLTRRVIRGEHLNQVSTPRSPLPATSSNSVARLYKSNKPPFTFLVLLVFLGAVISPVCTHEYDATGKKITFFPNAMMIATNPKALVFFNNTRLVNIHTDLNAFPRGKTLQMNTTCDPVQADFYQKVLASLRGIQRTTHRLLSIQGVTNFLECDSFLRRYYQYETGLPSQLFCATRHYENTLHECKSWAARTCRVTSSEELAWLRTRERRSSFMCHMGVFGLFRGLYKLFTRKSCETSVSSPLVKVLRDAGKTMSTNQQLTHVVNGKVVYLIKTTDVLSSKVRQLISSLRVMDTTFQTWSKQVASQMTREQCHYHANMEFISLYSLQVNRAMSSILRLTEIEDILRQMSHLTRKDLISFTDLPRFLTAELEIRLAKIPSMAHTIAALKAGFSIIMQPLVDYEFAASKKMQLNLLFTLPEVSSENALCILEQLVPITYRHNGLCFGGPLPRTDLSLITCGAKRYVLKSTELDQCSRDDTTILCPTNVLTTVKEPHWLGLPWSPESKLQFQQIHQVFSHCKQLQPLILLGGRYYLSTISQNITLSSQHATRHLQLSPLSIVHIPCNMSFHSQRTGLGTCPSTLRFSIPLFQNSYFSYIPWQSVSSHKFTLAVPDIPIPKDFTLDNSTLQSLDQTYNSLDRDLTLRLAKFNQDVNNLEVANSTTLNDIFTYTAFAFTVLNFIALLILFGRLRQLSSAPRHTPQVSVAIPLSSHTDASTLD